MPTTPIANVRIEDRHREDLGDLTGLIASIGDLGMLQPVVITPDGRLVAGERRVRAAQSLGWDSVPTHVVANLEDAAALLRAERDENTCRKAMTPTEEASVYAALLEIERPRHESRQGARTDLTSEKVAPKSRPSVATKRAASEGATGRPGAARTLDKVLAVKAIAVAPSTPEPVRVEARAALKEIDATGKVDGAYQRVKRVKSDAEERDALLGRYPDLAHYVETDRAADVLRLGRALDGYPEPERTARLGTLRKSIAAEKRRAAAPDPEPLGPDYVALTNTIFDACNRASRAIANSGGADAVRQALPLVDHTESANWRAEFSSLAARCAELAEACKPIRLRSVT